MSFDGFGNAVKIYEEKNVKHINHHISFKQISEHGVIICSFNRNFRRCFNPRSQHLRLDLKYLFSFDTFVDHVCHTYTVEYKFHLKIKHVQTTFSIYSI